MAGLDPFDQARAFHELLVEVLRRLNQSYERAGSVEGLELLELDRALSDFWGRRAGEVDLRGAVDLLLENGMVRAEDDPVFAWDRRRTLGRRYLITALGKSFLLRQLLDEERIR